MTIPDLTFTENSRSSYVSFEKFRDKLEKSYRHIKNKFETS